jgi:Ca2+-binding RTX toxin-like protein
MNPANHLQCFIYIFPLHFVRRLSQETEPLSYREPDGVTGNDILIGGAGDDALQGGSGDDRLRGDASSDYLDGGEGADRLDGGPGDDRLAGGAGPDRFVFVGIVGHDTVDDLEPGDRLFIARGTGGIETTADITAALSDADTGAVISLDTDDSITLYGLTAGDVLARAGDLFRVF